MELKIMAAIVNELRVNDVALRIRTIMMYSVFSL